MPIGPHLDPKLPKALDRAFIALGDHDPGSEEYENVLNHLVKLHKMKVEETPPPRPVSPDTLVLAVTNIIGLYLIIKHENVNVITTKALGFVLRPR